MRFETSYSSYCLRYDKCDWKAEQIMNKLIILYKKKGHKNEYAHETKVNFVKQNEYTKLEWKCLRNFKYNKMNIQNKNENVYVSSNKTKWIYT